MDAKLIERFMASQDDLKQSLSSAHPDEYIDLVRSVIYAITSGDGNWGYGDEPDPERIHRIDDGDYQGTLVFVIAAKGYQPSTYWYVKVGYGSCSGCDTLQAINEYSYDPPNEKQISDYLTLALHIAQGLKKMGDD